ncbi:unnamed protein product [Enterobius vermicularis]|uniref:CCHC-type domain-containing protein n=1 Tax=Enterobius vermicularis TaxID=51028 RepID=A0A0N4VM50_ENTVE|nr:unnamed protein product [Enterobius vermicularis]
MSEPIKATIEVLVKSLQDEVKELQEAQSDTKTTREDFEEFQGILTRRIKDIEKENEKWMKLMLNFNSVMKMKIIGNSQTRSDFYTTYAVTQRYSKEPTNPCVFCKGNHFNSNCTVYKTLEQRKRRAYELGLCIQCSRSGHRFKDCKANKVCYYCKKNHNSAFCDRFGNEATSANSPIAPVQKDFKKETATPVTTVETDNI